MNDPVYDEKMCAQATVRQHRIIIIGASSCRFTADAVKDAQARLRPLGIVPILRTVDDGTLRARETMDELMKSYKVQSLVTGEAVSGDADIARLQGTRVDRLLYPQVFWRQEGGRPDRFIAWGWGRDQVRDAVSGAVRLYEIRPPQTTEDVRKLMDQHEFIVFGYDWCPQYHRVANALQAAHMSGYLFVPMDNASDAAKSAVASRFATLIDRPIDRFTSPLVVRRGIFAGNGDETLAWLAKIVPIQ